MSGEKTAFELLKELANALDTAFISSWQTTAAWQKELNAALIFIADSEEKHENN